MNMRGEFKMQTSTEKECLVKERSDVTEKILTKEQKTNPLWAKRRALTMNIMEQVSTRENIYEAYKKVFANKGAPGVDGMTVDQLLSWIQENKTEFFQSLLDGSYKPSPVKRVNIPKPDGGERMLGIPTVVDRLAQQAILQILDPIIDPTFSESSFGFRIGRGCHQALKQAQEYVTAGYGYVADFDLEKCFDSFNHDLVMARLARHIGDKRLLRIVRKFLQSGMMEHHGMFAETTQGTPQGGPLSPLLSNIMLDDLDKELEKRGHKFCRYADDSNIYVKSQAAADRVLASIKKFIEQKLKLKVNLTKSAATVVQDRKFLSYVLSQDGKLLIADKALKRFKDKVRKITRRSKSADIEAIVGKLNQLLCGWLHYFKLNAYGSDFKNLDSWIRRKLRCFRLKQRKRSYSIATWLTELGIKAKAAWNIGKSSKGWWRLSRTPQLHKALSNQWFEKELKLFSLLSNYNRFQSF